MTVKELKDIIANWSEYDSEGNPAEIWVGTLDGKYSNDVTRLSRLNTVDILLHVD